MYENEWKEHLTHWLDYLKTRRSDLIQAYDESNDLEEKDSFGWEKTKVERQIKAIEQAQYAAVKNPQLLLDFIQGPVSRNNNESNIDLSYILDLNDSQKRAVQLALGESNLCLIQGPPGTGKTQVIAEICIQLYRQNPQIKILVCAETHVAVNNLITRISQYAQEIRMVRIRDKGENEELQQFLPKNIIKDYLEWLNQYCTDPDVKAAIGDSMSNPKDITLEKSLALSANITGMTCNRVGDYYFDGGTESFDVVIIDEVCKATLPEILMPLAIANAAILVGDPKQLPPVFCSEETETIQRLEHFDLMRYFFINDLFDNHKHIMLDTQYRMVDEIGTMVSTLFYDGALKNGREVAREQAIVWIDYQPSHHWPILSEINNNRPILKNEDERDLILSLLSQLDQSAQNGTTVGIITPYRQQREAINSLLEHYHALKVEVDTVDGFQGRECDIVIFSITRTIGSYRFLTDPRRLNVALSRARNQIYMVGCKEYASKQPLLNAILDKASVRLWRNLSNEG